MPHNSMCMSEMKNPTKRFCEVICGVQNARTMYELDFESFFPVLDRKIRDVNVPRGFGGPFGVHHLNGGHVVLYQTMTKAKKDQSTMGSMNIRMH